MEGAIVVLIVLLGGLAFWILWRIFRNLGDLGLVKGRKAKSPHRGDLVKVDGVNIAEARRIGTGWAITVRGPNVTRNLRIYRLSDSIGPAPLDSDDIMVIQPGIAAEGADHWLVAEGMPLRAAFSSCWHLDGGILETWVHEASHVEARLEEGLQLAALLSQRPL
jgi:hypothetical protein